MPIQDVVSGLNGRSTGLVAVKPKGNTLTRGNAAIPASISDHIPISCLADNFSIDVTTSAEDNVTVKVYDMTGKLIETLRVNNEILDEIHQRFNEIVYQRGYKIHSFYEARGFMGVVPLNGKVSRGKQPPFLSLIFLFFLWMS